MRAQVADPTGARQLSNATARLLLVGVNLWKATMTKRKSRRIITERAVRRAFAHVFRDQASLEKAITDFMGGYPVPPLWSMAGVRASFGRRAARVWAKHLRHLGAAHYPSNGRNLVPVVQHLADFGVDALPSPLPALTEGLPAGRLILMDESWMFTSSPEFSELMRRSRASTQKIGDDLIKAVLEAAKDSADPEAQPAV